MDTACHKLPFRLHLRRNIYRRMLCFVPVTFLYKNITFSTCKFYVLLEIASLSFPLPFTACRGSGNALNVRTTVVNRARDMRGNLQLPKHKAKYPVLEFTRVTPSKTLLLPKDSSFLSHRRRGSLPSVRACSVLHLCSTLSS